MTPDESPAPRSLALALVQHLESLARAGISHIPRPPFVVPRFENAAPPSAVPSRGASPPASTPPAMPRRPDPTPRPVPTPAAFRASNASSRPAPSAKPSALPPTKPPQTTPPAPSLATPSLPSTHQKTGSLPPADLLPAEPLPPPLAESQRKPLLEVIRREVAACQACALAPTRIQTVFGEGPLTPQICFVGEGPGADEDESGRPFVGRAGQLLTKIIEASRLRREDVFILNAVKCRPPNNRTPLPEEVAACRGFLERQLEILHPQYICCLGAVASKALLRTEISIGRLRGRFHDYRGIPVICTYHPSYLLRNPNAKKDVWEDMKMLMLRLGVEL